MIGAFLLCKSLEGSFNLYVRPSAVKLEHVECRLPHDLRLRKLPGFYRILTEYDRVGFSLSWVVRIVVCVTIYSQHLRTYEGLKYIFEVSKMNAHFSVEKPRTSKLIIRFFVLPVRFSVFGASTLWRRARSWVQMYNEPLYSKCRNGFKHLGLITSRCMPWYMCSMF